MRNENAALDEELGRWMDENEMLRESVTRSISRSMMLGVRSRSASCVELAVGEQLFRRAQFCRAEMAMAARAAGPRLPAPESLGCLSFSACWTSSRHRRFPLACCAARGDDATV